MAAEKERFVMLENIAVYSWKLDALIPQQHLQSTKVGLYAYQLHTVFPKVCKNSILYLNGGSILEAVFQPLQH